MTRKYPPGKTPTLNVMVIRARDSHTAVEQALTNLQLSLEIIMYTSTLFVEKKKFAQRDLFIEFAESSCEERKKKIFSLAWSKAVHYNDAILASYVFLRLVYITVESAKVNWTRARERAASFSRQRYTICHLSVACTIESKGRFNPRKKIHFALELALAAGPVLRFF